MSPLDTQLRSSAPTDLPALDHHALQQAGRRRRLVSRAVTGSTAAVVLIAAVVVGTGMRTPAPIAPIGPGGPETTASASPAETNQAGTPIAELRHALEATPADLQVSERRHLRVVSSLVRQGEEVSEWARVSVTDLHAEDDEVTADHATASLREGTATAELRDMLADIASQQDPLPADDDQGRWLREGQVETTTGGYEGDNQLQDAAAAATSGNQIAAAQRLGDALLSLSAGPEGPYWQDLLDVLEQLTPDTVTAETDLLGRDVTVFHFTAGPEQLQLHFDPVSGRPAGIDMLVDTGETTEDGTQLLHREVVVIP